MFVDKLYTPLVKKVETDQEGFFQAKLLPGRYSILMVENGKLYAGVDDSKGTLNPVDVSSGAGNLNITLTYKAVF